jgi:hypothetical protein
MASSVYKLDETGIPKFEDLPLHEGDPHHSAWGLYDKDDELGTLNRLTNERVVEAAKAEIKSGERSVNIWLICCTLHTFKNRIWFSVRSSSKTFETPKLLKCHNRRKTFPIAPSTDTS